MISVLKLLERHAMILNTNGIVVIIIITIFVIIIIIFSKDITMI